MNKSKILDNVNYGESITIYAERLLYKNLRKKR